MVIHYPQYPSAFRKAQLSILLTNNDLVTECVNPVREMVCVSYMVSIVRSSPISTEYTPRRQRYVLSIESTSLVLQSATQSQGSAWAECPVDLISPGCRMTTPEFSPSLGSLWLITSWLYDWMPCPGLFPWGRSVGFRLKPCMILPIWSLASYPLTPRQRATHTLYISSIHTARAMWAPRP